MLLQAAITNYHREGDLNLKHLFPTVLETRKSMTRASAHLASGEGPLLALQKAVFSLYPHTVERRADRAGSCVRSRILEGSTLARGPASDDFQLQMKNTMLVRPGKI